MQADSSRALAAARRLLGYRFYRLIAGFQSSGEAPSRLATAGSRAVRRPQSSHSLCFVATAAVPSLTFLFATPSSPRRCFFGPEFIFKTFEGAFGTAGWDDSFPAAACKQVQAVTHGGVEGNGAAQRA
jgi:hypothetical protein